MSRLFRGSGPLGNFGAKIDLGFLMGLYGREKRDDLHTIREIRNAFAHKTKTITFNSTEPKTLCKKLFTLVIDGSPRANFIWKVKSITGELRALGYGGNHRPRPPAEISSPAPSRGKS
jgi:hypothetical protein